ncbi:cell wall anchor protein [Rasiella rasia]|uniref:Cell wall anchor protein n=1 Tax=Rasiella rasia TaxID=2744027 RepID=A0A6G6GLK9_9FLAO|nr:cell wall anchor protein [Rasiella rasia]QIE59449.1 cell wall anchor protein [Rasiella rasia]
MKKLVIYLCIICTSLATFTSLAQVGIGTVSPDASSALDISSTTQGLLAPRMETSDRIAIASPAEGLLVFDTDENVFYFFNGGSWVPLEGAETRSNYKLVKSVADLSDELAAGGGVVYELNENYLYEINGTILFDFPIDLNGAYVAGRDTGEDILQNNSGTTLFSGSKGGHLKDILIRGNGQQVFNIVGSGTENLIAYSLIVVGASSLGTLSSLGTVYFEVFQIVSTSDGLAASDISNFYMDKLFWTDSNLGTFLTLSGSFANLQMANGRVVTDAGEVGLNVSANPTITVSASIAQVSFTGAGTRVEGYSPSIYDGYKFNNNWDVDSPGLLLETDNAAIGDINLDAPIGSGYETDFGTIGTGVQTKLVGTSTSNNLFRFSAPVDNRIVYDGTKTRSFQISTSISFQGDNNNSIYIFYIAKNGTVVDESKVYREIGGNNDIGAVSIVGSVELSQNDYIEVWAEKFSGAGSLLVVSLNLIAQ